MSTLPLKLQNSKKFFPDFLRLITDKILDSERITDEEGMLLFEEAELPQVGVLANYIRQKFHQNKTYYNRNFHIEPTNVCVFSCKFCSYSRLYKNREEGWELSIQQMLDIVKNYQNDAITEVHIVGGVHPKMDLDFFCNLIRNIKKICPKIHIKAFTAVELDYFIKKSKLTLEEGFYKLIEAGLNSIPGGGAEIFHPEIRKKISQDKCNTEDWLKIHETAHNLGLHSNATMLYGHIEKSEHLIHHMSLLRNLQDKTGGFKTFIPLKFRNQNNEMAHISECSFIQDLKVYAISRIYLDNFSNVKAYWPMMGRHKAQMTQSFGVNDFDGTIDDTTKIYSMAGSEEKSPSMTTQEICQLISSAGFFPVERNTNYDTISTKE